MHDELVLIDQPQLRQSLRVFHASRQQSSARRSLELLNGFAKIPTHELRVPIDLVQSARHDIFLRGVDGSGEGLHPISHPIKLRARPWPPRCFHHFVSHPPKKKGVGLPEILGCVTMEFFVSDYCPMIAAPV